MGPKVKQITLCTKKSKWNLVWFSKTGLESRGYHKSQVDHCVLYRKAPLNLICVDYCVIYPQKEYKTTSFIESLKNGTENYLFKDEGYIY